DSPEITSSALPCSLPLSFSLPSSPIHSTLTSSPPSSLSSFCVTLRCAACIALHYSPQFSPRQSRLRLNPPGHRTRPKKKSVHEGWKSLRRSTRRRRQTERGASLILDALPLVS